MASRSASPPVDLLAAVYDAAVEPSRWPDVVREVTRWVGGVAGGFQVRRLWPELSVGQVWSGLPPSFERAYLESFYLEDPWLARASALEEGATIASRDVLDDAEYLRTGFYNELCRPHGFRDLQGAMLLRDDARLVSFGMFRPDGQAFDEATRRRLDALVPHLSRALRVALELSEDEPMGALLGSSARARRMGVLRVDAQLHVLWAGDGTEAWLAQGAGPLEMVRRRLVLRDPRDEGRLREVVTRAIAGEAGAVVLGEHEGDLVHVVAAPCGGASPFRPERCAQLLFTAPVEEGRVASLQRAFGLTGAEARVAARVAKGHPLRRIAAELGVSYHTVRAHLRQCFAKTGARRQAALVAIVHASA